MSVYQIAASKLASRNGAWRHARSIPAQAVLGHRFTSLSTYEHRPGLNDDKHLSLVPSMITPMHQQRYIFTQLIQAISSPFETIQQIKDTKKMLEDVKEDFLEQYELSKVPRINTFEPLPGFYPRPRETRSIQMVLSTQPSFLVIFGGSSVGKTALLRQVLSSTEPEVPKHHKKEGNNDYDDDPDTSERHNHTSDRVRRKFVVMHIDLRIAGFADLAGLAIRLATQFEQFFETIMNSPKEDGVYKTEEECLKDGTNYKRINAQYAAQYTEAFKGHMLAFRQLRKQYEGRIQKVMTATGNTEGAVTIGDIAAIMERFQSSLLAYWQFEVNTEEAISESEKLKKKEAEGRNRRSILQRSKSDYGLIDFNAVKELDEMEKRSKRIAKRLKIRTSPIMNPNKRIPVILLDEAHRLPALIESKECIKELLDSFLVLTKQDRLCHVIHTTSDPFYLHWLRAFNISQHTKIFTIQDCTYNETKDFFYSTLIPATVEKLPSPGIVKQRLPKFDDIWDVFGGRLAHISDYIAEFIFSDGTISPQESSHFTQAYINIKLHLTHHSFMTHSSIPDIVSQGSEFDSKVFSLIIHDLLRSRSNLNAAVGSLPLLPKYTLDYFEICEKYGADKVNSVVASRILDISWSPPATTALNAASLDSVSTSTSLPPPTPADALSLITPPKLHAMSRVFEKAMEVVFSEPTPPSKNNESQDETFELNQKE